MTRVLVLMLWLFGSPMLGAAAEILDLRVPAGFDGFAVADRRLFALKSLGGPDGRNAHRAEVRKVWFSLARDWGVTTIYANDKRSGPRLGYAWRCAVKPYRALIILKFLLCAGWGWAGDPSAEPAYRGRTLSSWAAGAESKSLSNREKRGQAIPDLRIMAHGSGQEAVPILTRLLDERNPYARARAAEALGKAGPEAREAIPALRRLVQDHTELPLRKVPPYRRPDTVGVCAANALNRIEGTVTFQRASAINPHHAVPLGESPDGKVAVKIEGDSLQWYEKATGKTLGQIPRLFRAGTWATTFKPQTSVCWSFSRDGKYLAIGEGYRRHVRDEPDNIGDSCVVNITTGHVVATLSGFLSPNGIGAVEEVSFSEDGKTVFYRADQYEHSVN
jgi:hypothetical protein